MPKIPTENGAGGWHVPSLGYPGLVQVPGGDKVPGGTPSSPSLRNGAIRNVLSWGLPFDSPRGQPCARCPACDPGQPRALISK